MVHRLNVFPDLCLLAISLCIQVVLTRWAIRDPFWNVPRRMRIFWFVNGTAALVSITGYLLGFQRMSRRVPDGFATWTQAVGLGITAILIGAVLALLVWRSMPEFRSPRRQFLQATGAALGVAPVVGTAFGYIVRDQFQIREVRVQIPNLPKDLAGVRLVQLTDIHLSPFLSERQFARAVDMANETKAHVALVTGDLITRHGDPLDQCLRQLARLRADAGVLGCLGNHEIYTRTEDYVTEQGKRIGIEFLRLRARLLRFGTASLNVAGVDYQPFASPYLQGAELLVAPGAVNVMLSHNPDVFPAAARKGFDLTLAGHTHGGQVNVEILHQNINFARTFTPFVRGLYVQGGSSIYVSSGIGTIGVPVRVGAPAEIALITLCPADT